MKKEIYGRRNFLNTTAKLSLSTAGAMFFPVAESFSQSTENISEKERNIFGRSHQLRRLHHW